MGFSSASISKQSVGKEQMETVLMVKNEINTNI